MVEKNVGRGHFAEHFAAGRRALFEPARSDLIRIGSRRWFLQTGLAGIAGLSLPDLLRRRSHAALGSCTSRKAVILFWLSGGPSHLDLWDPKPNAPVEVRGPFDSIATKVPGVRFCEHLPLQAGIADRLAVIRSVDCRDSNDHHCAVMQSGNSQALKDLKPSFAGPLERRYPSMGSIAAKFRGANDRQMPAFIGMADPNDSLWNADVWRSGHLGTAYDPIRETDLIGRLNMPQGVSVPRAGPRRACAASLTACEARWTPARPWPASTSTAGRPWKWSYRERRARPSKSSGSPTGSGTPTAATVLAKRPFWPAG